MPSTGLKDYDLIQAISGPIQSVLPDSHPEQHLKTLVLVQFVTF